MLKYGIRIILGVLGLFILLCLGYLMLMSFPEPLFPYSISYNNIECFSDQPLSRSSTENILDKVYSKVSHSELFNEQETYKVFLCHSSSMFHLLNPFQKYAIGVNASLLNGYTYIRTPNIKANQMIDWNNQPIPQPKTLANTIAHEITHKLVVDKIGKKAFRDLDRWIIEGYAEYVGIGSISHINKERVLNKEIYDLRTDEKYQIYHLLVQDLLEVQHKSVNQMLTNNLSLRDAMEAFMNSESLNLSEELEF